MQTTYDPVAIGDPVSYGDPRKLHELLAWMRRERPLCWIEPEGVRPFWAVTKYADVKDIESRPAEFLAQPRTVLSSIAQERANAAMLGNPNGVKTIVHMDGAEHRAYRQLTNDWFQPRNLQAFAPRVAAVAEEFVGRMAGFGGMCDFAADVARYFPLRVIMTILGVPPEDEPIMLRLTQELFGAADEDMQRGSLEDVTNVVGTIQEFGRYFQGITEKRRAKPQNDVASVIANATIDGRPIGDFEAMSYYIIIATAGHDTTSGSLSGGLLALLERPDQLAKLQENPGLLPLAAEEMFRWTTPVKHFMRTAVHDCAFQGQAVKAGDSLLLHFDSANRDEDAFDTPNDFRVDREPNPHVAFGHGPHFCLGKHLAKMELEAFFRALLPRLERMELDGTPAYTQSGFVSGLKRLPVRFRFA